LAWASCWLWPWQDLPGIGPWLRTGLAVGLVIAPGAVLARLVSRDAFDSWAAALPVGLTLSMLIVGAIGAVASFVHASFGSSVFAFVLLGTIVVFLGARAGRPPAPTEREGRPWSARVVTLVGWAVVLWGARLGFDPGLTTGDELTHIARTRQLHGAAALGVEEHLLAGGEALPPRFWLAFWPLAKAFVAELSALDPLELQALWLEPFLVALALLAVFSLARSLGLSEALAWLAVAGQLACWSTMTDLRDVGFVALTRSTEDKVVGALVFAPVFFGASFSAAARGGARRWVHMALCGASLTFTHGPILGMAVVVVVLLAAIESVRRRRWSPLVATLAIAMLLVLPQLALRTVDHPMNAWVAARASAVPQAEFDARLDASADGRFYGIGSDIWLQWPSVLLALAALLAWKSPRSAARRFVFAYVLLLAVAIVPYTAWILGRVLTPTQLWRIAWMAPFGVALAGLIGALPERWRRAAERGSLRWASGWAGAAVGGLAGASVVWCLVGPNVERLPGLDPAADWSTGIRAWAIPPQAGELPDYADLARIGRRIDELAAGPVVVGGDSAVNDLLPTVSRQCRLVVFRNPLQSAIHAGVEKERAQGWMKRWRRVVRAAEASGPRRAFVRRHRVDYLVLRRGHPWLVRDAQDLELLLEAGDFVLARVVGSTHAARR